MTEHALNRTIQDVWDACGPEVAEGLVMAFRGERIYVPRREYLAGHELAERMGFDNALRLAEHFAGERIAVPVSLTDESPARRALVLRLAGQGMKRREIARRAGITEARVYQILADHGDMADPRQGSLF